MAINGNDLNKSTRDPVKDHLRIPGESPDSIKSFRKPLDKICRLKRLSSLKIQKGD